MVDGVLIDAGNTVVAEVYGWGGTPPAGQTFVPLTDLTGIDPGQVVLPLLGEAQTAFNTGLAVTSTSNPTGLDATYPIDATTQSHAQAEMIALLNSAGATFADGTNSLGWPDINGDVRTFNTTQARSFFVAMGAYVAALYKVQNGTLTTMPTTPVNIA